MLECFAPAGGPETSAMIEELQKTCVSMPRISDEWAKQVLYDAFTWALKNVIKANPLTFGWKVDDFSKASVLRQPIQAWIDIPILSLEEKKNGLEIWSNPGEGVYCQPTVRRDATSSYERMSPNWYKSWGGTRAHERVRAVVVVDLLNKELHAIGYGPESNTIVVFEPRAEPNWDAWEEAINKIGTDDTQPKPAAVVITEQEVHGWLRARGETAWMAAMKDAFDRLNKHESNRGIPQENKTSF